MRYLTTYPERIFNNVVVGAISEAVTALVVFEGNRTAMDGGKRRVVIERHLGVVEAGCMLILPRYLADTHKTSPFLIFESNGGKRGRRVASEPSLPVCQVP